MLKLFLIKHLQTHSRLMTSVKRKIKIFKIKIYSIILFSTRKPKNKDPFMKSLTNKNYSVKPQLNKFT